MGAGRGTCLTPIYIAKGKVFLSTGYSGPLRAALRRMEGDDM